MKLRIKILIVTALVLVLLFITAYILVAFKGKTLLTQKLEEALKQKVSIGYLGFKAPLNLEVRDLEIENMVKVDYVYASINLLGLLGRKIIFNEVKILKPEISWIRKAPTDKSAKKASSGVDAPLVRTKEVTGASRLEEKQAAPIIVKYLSIKQGIINFTDQAIPEPGIKLTLKEASLNIDNLYLFPKSVITDFQLNAKIPWREDSGEGTIHASGWINLYKKDMQARLEIEGIDGVYLYPYYSYWVDLENSRIKKADLNFISDIQGENNDVVAKCRLELTNIEFIPRPPDQPENKTEKIATAILGIFRALNQGRVVLNFTIRTKIDKPEFKVESISQAVGNTIKQAIKSGKASMEDVASLPGKLLEGLTTGTTGATKAIINGALSVGKSLKDAILDALKTEKEPVEQKEKDTGQESLLEINKQ